MLHSLHYAFKTTIKNKATLIWTFIFPIVLATFMYISFGNIYNDELVMSIIPVAVEEGELADHAVRFFEAVKQKNGDPYFELEKMTPEDASKALENKEVAAIVKFKEDGEGYMMPVVVVGGEDFKHEIVVTVANAYNRWWTDNNNSVKQILKYSQNEDDEAAMIAMFQKQKQAEKLIKDIYGDNNTDEVKLTSYEEINLAKGPQNIYNNFFYAIFAMGCLFSAMGALEMSKKLIPGRTPLSQRNNVSSTTKLTMVVSHMFMQFLVVFAAQMIAYFYMRFIGVGLTDNVLAVAGILAAGAMFGISLGVLIGALPGAPEGAKVGICVALTMVLSFLSDLCTTGLKAAIERNFPIFNRISPAALISDSFMSVYVYDDYYRYFRNLITLAAMAVVLTAIAIRILSRSRANKIMLRA